MNGIKNSNPISLKRLQEIAYWIELDISKLELEDAYDRVLSECELMYSEVLKVITGSASNIYPELNSYGQKKLLECKNMMVLLNLELEVSYPSNEDIPEAI